jgi:hypothetical protein
LYTIDFLEVFEVVKVYDVWNVKHLLPLRIMILDSFSLIHTFTFLMSLAIKGKKKLWKKEGKRNICSMLLI